VTKPSIGLGGQPPWGCCDILHLLFSGVQSGNLGPCCLPKAKSCARDLDTGSGDCLSRRPEWPIQKENKDRHEQVWVLSEAGPVHLDRLPFHEWDSEGDQPSAMRKAGRRTDFVDFYLSITSKVWVPLSGRVLAQHTQGPGFCPQRHTQKSMTPRKASKSHVHSAASSQRIKLCD
jgi:hypothetical protein